MYCSFLSLVISATSFFFFKEVLHRLGTRYKTCLAFDNVPMNRIYDDTFWAFLFKLIVYKAKQNTPEKIYDYLLPYTVFPPLVLV